MRKLSGALRLEVYSTIAATAIAVLITMGVHEAFASAGMSRAKLHSMQGKLLLSFGLMIAYEVYRLFKKIEAERKADREGRAGG